MSPDEQYLPEQFAANERQLAEDWLKFSIEKFQANIRKLRIGSTGELLQSFRGEVVSAAGGDELKLRLAYAVQGMFVDMGVGRGMGAGATKGSTEYNRLRNAGGKLLRHERKAKRWYAKQMGRERHRLGELYSNLTGRTLIASIATALPTEPVNIDF